MEDERQKAITPVLVNGAVVRGLDDEALVRTKRESPERRNALASLENISRARVARMRALPRTGGIYHSSR